MRIEMNKEENENRSDCSEEDRKKDKKVANGKCHIRVLYNHHNSNGEKWEIFLDFVEEVN